MTENIATETNLKLTTPTDREIATTRVFDAPRGLVFDALTIVKEASLFSHRSCSPRSLSGPSASLRPVASPNETPPLRIVQRDLTQVL